MTFHEGRALTGLCFGRRGQPLYARLYDKTREAKPDAPIREVWRQAGYDAARHGKVWRVEFELRSELLRALRADSGHLPTEPRALVASHLDEIWTYLVTEWLVMRDRSRPRTRLERFPPTAWWAALATITGLNGKAFGPSRKLARQLRMPDGTAGLLKVMAGTLATVAAVRGIPSLSGSLEFFERYMRESAGEEGFSRAVSRAEARRGITGEGDPEEISDGELLRRLPTEWEE